MKNYVVIIEDSNKIISKHSNMHSAHDKLLKIQRKDSIVYKVLPLNKCSLDELISYCDGSIPPNFKFEIFNENI